MNHRRSITSLDKETESALVQQAKAGDFDAFDKLVRSCERRIWAVCWRLLGDKEETENALQTAFLKAMEGLEGFRGEAGFCTWIARIATNESLEILRRRKRHDGLSLDALSAPQDDDGPIPLPELLVDWREDPSRSVEREELRRILDTALDELTPGLRAVFVLRDMEGLSTADTAERLGITEGNAKVRLLRARLVLRELLTKAFGGDELVHSHLEHGGLGGLASAMEGRA